VLSKVRNRRVSSPDGERNPSKEPSMIHINCDGPIPEDTGRSFCPIKPAANEFSCETCREYQTRLATFESENRLELDMEQR
jgi:hypothetical protein